MVQSCKIPAWEKQALLKAVRVVLSNPQTVKRTFDKCNRSFDLSPAQPPCTCSSVGGQDGTKLGVDGLLVLVRVKFPLSDRSLARPNDPLPLPGGKVRSQLIKDLVAVAEQISAELPDVHRMLPHSLWSEIGATLREARSTAQRICESQYVHIVDKGVEVMWGFRKHWMWGVLEEFLKKEGYIKCTDTSETVAATVRIAIHANGWDDNPDGRLATLYLIGKAKSLLKAQWLWRPIAALPQPLLHKRDLKVAARATTALLQLLAEEIPGNFMVHSVNRVADWFYWLDGIQCTYLVELDCKDQFNHVPPSQVASHLTQSTDWVAKRRRWRSQEIVWSIHRESKRLDRAGQANSGKFWFLTNDELIKKVKFELRHNNYVQSTGSIRGIYIWRRTGCIPMGGSFSAQSADLHCQWQVYKHRGKFRDLGQLRISDSGFVYWEAQWGNVTLCQFRDNILMATSFLDHPTIGIVKRVLTILQSAWSLRVLCPCDDTCRATCLSTSAVAMGYCLVLSTEGSATAYIQPSSLTPQWDLKLGPPWVSPHTAHPKYLHGIFTGVLSNSQPWAKSHLAQLLSVAAWCQVAVLSGYSQRDTRHAMHSAIVCSYATSDHDYTDSGIHAPSSAQSSPTPLLPPPSSAAMG